MRADRFDLPLRIVVENPVPGLAIALQRGAAARIELVGPAMSSGGPLAFDFEITVDGVLPDGRPRLLGPYVQGPPDGRFVYLSVGRLAGQPASPWGGRVKVPLSDLEVASIDAMPPGWRLEARISGRGRKDGPALASVPLLEPGWKAVGA